MMNESQKRLNITDEQESSLKKLASTIEDFQGEFMLIFAHCNYTGLRERLVQRLQEFCLVETVVIQPLDITLYTTIQTQITGKKPLAVMVLGLETVINLRQMLASADQVREEFQKNFHFPLILWVDDRVQVEFMDSAPNFDNWGITKEFTITKEELAIILKDKAEEFFTHNSPQLTHGEALALEVEIEAAQRDFHSAEDLELEANLQSLLGFVKDINKKRDSALEHYQKGFEVWQQLGNLERQGTILSKIAFCYYLQAFKQPLEHPDWQKTRNYLEQALQAWEQAKRPDLMADSITKLGRIFRKLEDWEKLKEFAKKALEWHQKGMIISGRIEDYTFLAEVALVQEQWEKAINLAQESLKLHPPIESENQVVIPSFSRCYFIKARAQQHLGKYQEAIENLEIAERSIDTRYKVYLVLDVQLYLDILYNLRQLYFDNQEYRKAFEIKQRSQRTKYRYGRKPFIGASHLESKEILAPTYLTGNGFLNLPREIISSGRDQDVKNLVQWVKRKDKKVIVIYGVSGVGKSSLIKAGLVPSLEQEFIGLEKFIPVYIRSYTNWLEELGKKLKKALAKNGINLTNPLNSSEFILEQLQKSQSQNLRFVLIFDQFEEFFFIADTEALRNELFEFLGKCLDIITLKVIFSLRQDYIHLLLNRPGMTKISDDILSKNVLYEITNFSVDTAKSLIDKLTQQSNLRLEEDLIEELVKDLGEKDDQIRPIELQVVGAQLQQEKIINLEQYQKCGSKEELVKRYLKSVVQDCGRENEKLANLILFLLTNEKDNRPLKTRFALEKELKDLGENLTLGTENLDLVLEILVASRLVFEIPENPENSYQLVHDYLVYFIREAHASRFLEQLETSKEINRQTEAELQETRQQLEQLLEVVKRNRQRAEQERKQTEQVKEWLENATFEALNSPFMSPKVSGFTDYKETLEMVVNSLEKLQQFSQKFKLEKLIFLINDVLEDVQTNSFAVAVVGEFKRGKSTFINALIGEDILPTDINPCTATVTRVTYGIKPLVKVIFTSGLVEEIATDKLSDYVTQLTPEVEKIAAHVKEVIVYHPVSYCQNNVDIIDTPGLNNEPNMTNAVLSILPKVDAIIMVIMAQTPLSKFEQEFIETRLLNSDIVPIIFVVTGIDRYSNSEDVEKAIQYIRNRISHLVMDKIKEKYSEDSPLYEIDSKKLATMKIYPLSAYQALQAKKNSNNQLLIQSRFPEFEEALEKFLTQERGGAFLQIPINRIIHSANEILKTISLKQNALDIQQNKLLDDYKKLFSELKTEEDSQIYFINLIKKELEEEHKYQQIPAQVLNKIFQLLEKVQEHGDSKLTKIKNLLNEQYAKLKQEEIQLKPQREELDYMAGETQIILSNSLRLSQRLRQQVNMDDSEL
ncbi:MAG: hypothetical protein F6K54_07045 [Okeania sp. SIO3B5]|uniref:nSTAND1 domain-containing NTPase n=1 Tax=Okeania sp. SIO3B5 TaxID=2607811 RepID=UPI001400F05C|nr:dynamin family protein [Okeania sp. SIO3B5]NEO52859.1 hypothetical protein [Okeania sp. SIO3B5]